MKSHAPHAHAAHPEAGAQAHGNTLRVRRLGIDTYQELVVYMRSDSHISRAEGFEAHSRIEITRGDRHIIATLNVVHGGLLKQDEAGLSESAWRALGASDGDLVSLSHPAPNLSFQHVRAKIYGKPLTNEAAQAIITDIATGRYADIQITAFLTACSGNRMDIAETVALTRAMVAVGRRLDWGTHPVVDKHCIGGLPGNRTTLLIVPIVAACGLTIPKTSSRAITSPAGTADTMETLAPVALSMRAMRQVVEQEGGCIAWGGTVNLSPADDMLIRVERSLSLDGDGQLVASILSKKVAAGSSHVVIDIPMGPTTKIRSPEAGTLLVRRLEAVAGELGVALRTIVSDGHQPVGRGIGPALEAHDVLAVLQNDPAAPQDLRERSLTLAGAVLELGGKAAPGQGYAVAKAVLESGRAWTKFQAICKAQGGMREPPLARHTEPVRAQHRGVVKAIDNRRLARVAGLAGAPKAHAAGLLFHAQLGSSIEIGQPLYTIHAESPGELAYALSYARAQEDLITIEQT